MKKPQYIVDEEGKKVGVLLSIEVYESLLEELDEVYCSKLFQKAIEANEPSIPLEEYLKKKRKLASNV